MIKTQLRKSTSALAALVSLLALGNLSQSSEPRLPVIHAINPAPRQPAVNPVRLPPIDLFSLQPVETSAFAFTPIASFDLVDSETPPALTLGLGQPGGEKPSIGGWISFGFSGRGLTQ
jgi:hypothetical protein